MNVSGACMAQVPGRALHHVKKHKVVRVPDPRNHHFYEIHRAFYILLWPNISIWETVE